MGKKTPKNKTYLFQEIKNNLKKQTLTDGLSVLSMITVGVIINRLTRLGQSHEFNMVARVMLIV